MDPTDPDGMKDPRAWTEDLFHQRHDGVEGECPYTCPVCMGLSLMKQMRPEVAVHLVAAGREFFLAAKAFMDAMAEPRDESPRSRVQKIDLD